MQGVLNAHHFRRQPSDRTGSREQSPSPTPSPPTFTNTTDESSLPRHLKEHIHSVNHLELAGSPSAAGLAARGKVRDGKLPGKRLETELNSPEVTKTESTSLPRFPNVHVHTLEELLTSSESSQTPPGQHNDRSDIAHTQSASHHSGLRVVGPQTTGGHHFSFSASTRTVPVGLQSASEMQQPRFESKLWSALSP